MFNKLTLSYIEKPVKARKYWVFIGYGDISDSKLGDLCGHWGGIVPAYYDHQISSKVHVTGCYIVHSNDQFYESQETMDDNASKAVMVVKNALFSIVV